MLIEVDPAAYDRRLRQPGGDRFGLALGGDGGQLLVLDDTRGQLVRERTDGDAAGRSGRLEAGGGVDGVAGEEAPPEAGSTSRRTKASPVLMPTRTCRGGRPAGSFPRGLRRCAGRLYGAFRIVFVDRRDAEDADHGVADELLDGATVALDHPVARAK